MKIGYEDLPEPIFTVEVSEEGGDGTGPRTVAEVSGLSFSEHLWLSECWTQWLEHRALWNAVINSDQSD